VLICLASLAVASTLTWSDEVVRSSWEISFAAKRVRPQIQKGGTAIEKKIEDDKKIE
jgi:hypothetical protein